MQSVWKISLNNFTIYFSYKNNGTVYFQIEQTYVYIFLIALKNINSTWKCFLFLDALKGGIIFVDVYPNNKLEVQSQI